MATLRFAFAKWLFRRSRVADPLDFLRKMGIDVRTSLQGFARWRPILEDALARLQREKDGQGGISLKDGIILFALVRAIQPEYVIETGVAAGISTSFLGAALIENGRGYLFSVELPANDKDELALADGSRYVWQERGVGWAVPESIKSGLLGRHSLVLRDVREALPEILARIPYLDLFFHDDLHTPDHMLWEYERVWPKLRPGGFLLSDDSNHGWIQFCNNHGFSRAALSNLDRLCVVRKPSVDQIGRVTGV
jgi:predicted O-methyltransferase YrrM